MDKRCVGVWTAGRSSFKDVVCFTNGCSKLFTKNNSTEDVVQVKGDNHFTLLHQRRDDVLLLYMFINSSFFNTGLSL